jgi:hypothetical protein
VVDDANKACNLSPAIPPFATPKGSARARLTMSGVVGVSGGGVKSGEEGEEELLGDFGGAGRRGGIVRCWAKGLGSQDKRKEG